MNLSNFVAYVKQAWKNKPDTSTPLSAERLTHQEEGIKGNSDAIQELAAAVVSQIVNNPDKIASMAALYAVDQKVAGLDGKIGDTSKLPAGTTDAVGAIAQLYSNFDKFKMTSWGNSITVNTSCVSKLDLFHIYRCCGWIFGEIYVTFTTTCTNIYTAYLLGTIKNGCLPNVDRSCLTIVSTDDKDENGNPWLTLKANGELYLNVRNTPIAGTRNYMFFIIPE